ncbi:MAG: hypothetical protein ISS78_00270 [Phycisphaerae bacterium]|nr:hypothetical protein [Phycisphaerae bacterium]
MSSDGGSVTTQRQARCPGCGAILKVPAHYYGNRVKCSKCRRRFHLNGSSVSEDEIANWLDQEDLAQTQAAPSGKSAKPAAMVTPTRGAPAKPVQDAPGPIRLVKFDRSSALFEFPASRLEDPRFRCAMPRQCLQCGARAHLRAHVIIYTPHLAASIPLEEERTIQPLVLSNQDVQSLGCEQLLARLPNVPDVPAPGNLPMPYWLCDMCGGSGTISGEIHVDTATGQGQCRLLICNLHRAEQFMAAAGGGGSPKHAELQQYLAEVSQTPWETVSLVVQHRLEQWFSPRKGERFLGYVPDRDRVRTEDGMAGLLLSTRRLIYHTQFRHREAAQSEPVELHLAMAGDIGNLRIKTSSWRVKHLRVDREGLARLRRSLTLGKYKAAWR